MKTSLTPTFPTALLLCIFTFSGICGALPYSFKLQIEWNFYKTKQKLYFRRRSSLYRFIILLNKKLESWSRLEIIILLQNNDDCWRNKNQTVSFIPFPFQRQARISHSKTLQIKTSDRRKTLLVSLLCYLLFRSSNPAPFLLSCSLLPNITN